VVYLETVLHGSNLASASKVTTWFGTSYLTPIFGAIIADTFLGNYNTIIVSLAVYLLVRRRILSFVSRSMAARALIGRRHATMDRR
jgi:dipeptide/tripeptide permease